MRSDIGAPPPAMTDSFLTECEWLCCNPACGAGRLVTTLLFFLVNVVAGIWGYIEGEMRAEDLQDEVDAWDIRTETYAAQTMFGRMFTVNLFIVTLVSLRTCCVDGSDGIVGMLCMPWTNADLRKSVHRIGGYFMVFSVIWHLWFAYYSYELSGMYCMTSSLVVCVCVCFGEHTSRNGGGSVRTLFVFFLSFFLSPFLSGLNGRFRWLCVLLLCDVCCVVWCVW